jgi:hypothetical protein
MVVFTEYLPAMGQRWPLGCFVVRGGTTLEVDPPSGEFCPLGQIPARLTFRCLAQNLRELLLRKVIGDKNLLQMGRSIVESARPSTNDYLQPVAWIGSGPVTISTWIET